MMKKPTFLMTREEAIRAKEERAAARAAQANPSESNLNNLMVDQQVVEGAKTESDRSTLESAAAKVMRPAVFGVDANGTIYTLEKVLEQQRQSSFPLQVTYKVLWAKAEDGTVIRGLPDPSPELAAASLQNVAAKNPQLFQQLNGGATPALQSATTTTPQPTPASTGEESSSDPDGAEPDFVQLALQDLGYAESVTVQQLNIKQMEALQKRIAELKAEHEEVEAANELRLGLSTTMATAADRVLKWTPEQQGKYRHLSEMIGGIEDPEALDELIKVVDILRQPDALKLPDGLSQDARDYLGHINYSDRVFMAAHASDPMFRKMCEFLERANNKPSAPPPPAP